MTDPDDPHSDIRVDPVSGLPSVTVGRPVSAAEVEAALDDE